MMWRVWVSVWVSVVLYLSLSLFFGNQGLLSYARVSRAVGAMEENLRELSFIQNRLQEQVRLLSSREEVRKEARRLLLVGEGEGVIDVVGLPVPQDPVSPGAVIFFQGAERDVRPLLRGVAVSVGLLVFLLSWLVVPAGERRRREGAPYGVHRMQRASR